MKKIIAIALILTCVFALFSCGDSDNTVENVNKMFNSVAPKKVVTETTEVFGEYTLTSTSTVKSGTVDGKPAATLEFSNMKLRTVEDGSGDTEELPWIVETGVYEYLDGKGLRITENGKTGSWDNKGTYNFAPTVGSGALALTAKTVQDIKDDKETKTVTFTVLEADTEAVFGYEIKSDVSVTVTHDGSAITGVTLAYTVPAKDKDHPDIETTVKILYSYDTEKITIK